MDSMSDFRSAVMPSVSRVPPLHQTFHPLVRGRALTLLGLLYLLLLPAPGPAQVPARLATVAPPALMALPPAVVITTDNEDSAPNTSTEPPVEVLFRPTMDTAVYEALKAEARVTPAPDVRRLPDGPSRPAEPGSRLAKNFEGGNQTLALGPGAGFFLPDTHGAIGPTQFVEVVNTALVVYDRNTGAGLKRVSLNSVFGYPTPPGGQCIFEPRATYDRDNDRFVVMAPAFAEAPEVQSFFIGISVMGDATGAFFVQQINVRAAPCQTNAFFDYPNVGSGTDAVFVTANNFAPGFVGADLLVFPKAPLFARQDGTVPVFQGLIGTLTPPLVLDGNLLSFLLANLPNTPFVALYELTGAGDPTTTTLADPFVITVGSYRIPRSARQPGVFNTLDTLDTRFVHASTQLGPWLFNVHTIDVVTFPTPRWYELDLVAHAVAQVGLLFETETSDDWNAAIVVNDTRDAFVTWSSANPFGSREGNPPYNPQVRASGRLRTDPPRVIPSGVVVFQSTMPLGQFRWGDYSAITLDPNNACCTWGENEKMNAFFTWGSRVFSSCLQ